MVSLFEDMVVILVLLLALADAARGETKTREYELRWLKSDAFLPASHTLLNEAASKAR